MSIQETMMNNMTRFYRYWWTITLATFFYLSAIPVYASTTTEVAKLLASDGMTFDGFGASVSIDGDRAVIGASGVDDNGDSSGAAYVFERDGSGMWNEVVKLLASDGATFDNFGLSVSIDGDRAVIGAFGVDDNGSASGAAYVFERDGSGMWNEVVKLLASDGGAGHQFGASVSLDDDRAVIGAFGHDENGGLSGAAYVFERDGSGMWNEVVKLLASDGVAIDQFGLPVSHEGDRAVIGARGVDDNGSASGAAYVFERDGSGMWNEVVKLLASDGVAIDQFGASVSLDGDRTVIGARGVGDNGALSGASYVFERDGSGMWNEVAKLLASDGVAGDQFSESLSLDGDRTVIGASGVDDNGNVSGAAYVFERDGSGMWNEVAKLLASDGVAVDRFGLSVSLDGNSTLIGAFGVDDNGSLSGATYVFVTPSEATKNLINTISGLGLPDNVKKALIAPLKNITKILEDGNTNNDGSVCGKLDEFIASIDAKESAGQLSVTDATLLRDAARTIKTSLDCP